MRKIFCAAVFLLFILRPVFGQWDFSLRAAPGASIPLGNGNFKTGIGGFAEFAWAFLPWLGVEIAGSYSNLPVADGSNVSFLEGGGGPFFQYPFNDRFSLRAAGNAGIYRMTWNNRAETLGRLGGVLSGEFRLSPYVSLYAFGGYAWYNNNPALNSVSAGAGISLDLTEIIRSESRVRGEKTKQERVFPVSYAWYETHPLAAVRITNNESGAVTDLSLSFYLERYMNRPVVFANIPRLAPGEQVEAPLTALFNESILDLTENIVTNAVVYIDYRKLGSKKQTRFPVQLPIYHRNAMSWDDDRRAASFVSARDPAAVYFAKHTASTLRPRLKPDVPPNVQYALGLFAALNIYGINYVIDPSSSYIELSEDASALDSLNYPYQTLFYHGGDCDDLSILFCSMLQVLGIDTAFITTPGHIYAAFDVGEVEAWPAGSLAAENLIEYGGKFWAPVEITAIDQGFSRAWRYGMRQWRDAGENRRIYPMRENWTLYPPVSVPGAGEWLPGMPEEADLIRAVSASLESL
jgi:hypothetical protein